LLLAFRRSIAHPGQPSATGAGAGTSSGASSLLISMPSSAFGRHLACKLCSKTNTPHTDTEAADQPLKL
jgi:hypothetical protein